MILVHCDGEAVEFAVVFHVKEGVLIYVAVEVHVRSARLSVDVPALREGDVLDTPVPLVLLHGGMTIEELREIKQGR